MDEKILDFGIRLVIIIPSAIFFISHIIKFFIEQNNINSGENITWDSFSMGVFIESQFIFIANGYIFIFELNQRELGILFTTIGIVGSLFILIGYKYNIPYLSFYFFRFIEGLLCLQIFYFGFYNIVNYYILMIIILFGFIIGINFNKITGKFFEILKIKYEKTLKELKEKEKIEYKNLNNERIKNYKTNKKYIKISKCIYE